MTADLFVPHFQDADRARKYLEALRWPNGPMCPHCGGRQPLFATSDRRGSPLAAE
jgi:hypothetical protein